MKRALFVSVVISGLAGPGWAADWGGFGIVSDTMGANLNRLCVGASVDARTSDFGCPTDAPLLVGSGLSVSGIVTATHFEGDGSRLTGIGVSDRITSGTTNVTANQDRSITLATAGSTRVTIGETGNVGIGTGSPLRLLDVSVGGTSYGLGGYAAQTAAVFRNTTSAVSNARISIIAGTSGASIIDFGDTVDDRGGVQYNHATESMGLLTNGAERLRITQTGNVGIGTTAPTSALQVSGTFTVSSTITNANPALYVSSSGNVGIGTGAPGQALTVVGTVNASGGYGKSGSALSQGLAFSGNTSLLVGGSAGDVGIGNANNSSQFFYGKGSSGNVGIGTTNPNAKLEVNGTISATNLVLGGVAISSQTDRIVSGTASLIANSSTGVSVSVPVEVSGTISATEVKVASTNEACTPEKYGTIRFVEATQRFEVCHR